MSNFKSVLLTLPSLTPSLALEVLPHGLTIHRLFVQADGRTQDIVIGPESPEDHVTQKYTNTIIGRYANRIPVGTHTLERNGINSELTALPNESPRVSLHGGPRGFDAVPWTRLTPENPPTLFSSAELSQLLSASSESSSAIFRLVSEDGDQGYPGRLVVEALIALIAPGEQERTYRKPGDITDNAEYDLGSVLLVYRAKLDRETNTVTPVNLTQHWGFNLEASPKDTLETLSVKNHTLTIKADRVAKLDLDCLGTGSFLSVSDAPAHAHSSKKIGDLFPGGNGYDDYYAFEDSANSTIPTRVPLSKFNAEFDLLKDLVRPSNNKDSGGRGSRAAPVVELSSERSGIKLVFDTNQHGVMFYANGLASPTKGARKKIHGGSGVRDKGDAYGPGTAAFLEFHDPLSAFLDSKNKNGEDTLVTSDELYHNYVRCDVRFKEPRR
ncbi:galactose mutarotase-like domain-containing protein [Crucibulum laeve]|uniref:Galactose mutarotase-like domain-containing protein n=1 Tax=Crucibulum laeve TaxID=68775 RepID=A0A5C3LWI6_9AGAR|nr:galactose mutarotase-like domain-containing protein [Crucibulum laeve]